MAESLNPRSAVYRALYLPALVMTSIGVLAHEAVRKHSHAVFTGPEGRRHSVKIDGTAEAALWRESVRAWIEHHPSSRATWAEAVDDGWPEYLIADKYHVFVHRRDDYDKSSRAGILDRQGPDEYMTFNVPLPGIDQQLQPGPRKSKQRITVRLVAIHDRTGRMTHATVFAPKGKAVQFQFDIDQQEVLTQIGKWLMQESTPWLDTILKYGSMVLPIAQPQGLPLIVTPKTQRPPQDESAETGQQAPPAPAAAVGDDVGPHFEATERTERGPVESDPLGEGGAEDTGTDS